MSTSASRGDTGIPTLDWAARRPTVAVMTARAMLDLKQRLSKLSEADRRIASAYILRLKHESPAGRRAMTRTMKAMDAGKKTRLRDLAKQLGHAGG